MSNKKDYWLYVKRILNSYPELKAEQSRLLDTRVTATYGGVGGVAGGISGNAVETAAMRELSSRDKKRVEAVEYAMRSVSALPYGASILKIISLVYFKRTHTLFGAAGIIPCHTSTAARYQTIFIKLVAEKLDLP